MKQEVKGAHFEDVLYLRYHDKIVTFLEENNKGSVIVFAVALFMCKQNSNAIKSNLLRKRNLFESLEY